MSRLRERAVLHCECELIVKWNEAESVLPMQAVRKGAASESSSDRSLPPLSYGVNVDSTLASTERGVTCIGSFKNAAPNFSPGPPQ
jgi:hypothetical protein